MDETLVTTKAAEVPGSNGDGTAFAGGDLMERCAWSVVWLGILLAGIDSSNNWLQSPWEVWVAPLGVLVGIVGGAWLWLDRRPVSDAMRTTSLIVALLAAFVPAAISIHARRYYTTDSSTFNQLAAEALVKGHNPFNASMAGAAHLLHPVTQFWTYTATGGHVTQVSYPAGSFLLVAPFVAVGFHHAIADWVNLLAWLCGAILVAALLPRQLRWLAGVLIVFGGFTGAFTAGGTDALFLPFLVLAVWRWDRVARPSSPGWQRWLSPVALGLACAIKQSPWFVVPFLLVGIWIEARQAGARPWREAFRYGLIAFGVFVLVNLPFVAIDPTSWLHSILLPFRMPLIPDGAGIVGMAIHGLTGGAVLWLLSLAGFLTLLGLLVAFVVRYAGMKRAWLFVLPVVLLLPPRSLESYLVDFIPAAIIAAVCVESATPPWQMARRWSLVAVGVPLVLGVLALTVGLSSAPLDVAVLGVGTSQHEQVFGYITIRVHNTTRSVVTPHFMVDLNGGHPDGFWRARTVTGHMPLAPGSSALVVLTPATFQWAPSHGSFWIVVAYTTGPNAVSTSTIQQWRLGPS